MKESKRALDQAIDDLAAGELEVDKIGIVNERVARLERHVTNICEFVGTLTRELRTIKENQTELAKNQIRLADLLSKM